VGPSLFFYYHFDQLKLKGKYPKLCHIWQRIMYSLILRSAHWET